MLHSVLLCTYHQPYVARAQLDLGRCDVTRYYDEHMGIHGIGLILHRVTHSYHVLIQQQCHCFFIALSDSLFSNPTHTSLRHLALPRSTARLGRVGPISYFPFSSPSSKGIYFGYNGGVRLHTQITNTTSDRI